MSQVILFPLLSDIDPATTSEGTLNPLGLYSIADSLAVKLAQGIRQRQSHPRFLTAMAVGSLICSNFDDDLIAEDGISEPKQIFEWYMVEGLVRTIKDRKLISGLPGIDKARQVLQDGVHLSASRYLKTPNVFGFHGVYRVLAKDLDIVDQYGHLGEKGNELVKTWEKEQKLEGFVDGKHNYYKILVKALKISLNTASVDRSSTWNGWTFFGNHLTHTICGQKEAQIIWDALIDSDFRGQLINFLISEEGQQVLQNSGGSEKRFHKSLYDVANPELQTLIDAILAYEQFSRLLQDAFDDCLFLMTMKKGKISPIELSKSQYVKKASKKIPVIFKKTSDLLEPFEESLRFEETFSSFAEKTEPLHWVSSMLEHHYNIQKKKPPNGKSPWFERFDDGSFIIKPNYRRDMEGGQSDDYVHFYRTSTLLSFAKDLKKVNS
jgi:hypothetical protein